jgi:hypothetical protein
MCSNLLAILFIILYLLNIDKFFHSFFFKKLYLNLIYLKGSFLYEKFLDFKDSYWFRVQETFLYFQKLWIKYEKIFSICLFYYNLQTIFFQLFVLKTVFFCLKRLSFLYRNIFPHQYSHLLSYSNKNFY